MPNYVQLSLLLFFTQQTTPLTERLIQMALTSRHQVGRFPLIRQTVGRLSMCLLTLEIPLKSHLCLTETSFTHFNTCTPLSNWLLPSFSLIYSRQD